MAVFVLCLLSAALLSSAAADDVRPRLAKVAPLRTPLNMMDLQWKQVVKKLKPKLDSTPRGTKPVPSFAGKLHAVNSHIIGGSQASVEQFPWQAAILADGGWFCGGSLIYVNWVMTAAHCIGKSSKFQVTLGSENRTAGSSSSVQVLSVLRINTFVHSKYNPQTLAFDIALLRLPRAITVPTSSINLIRLPRSTDYTNSFTGVQARVSGWGLVADGGKVNPLMQWASVVVMDSSECAKTYGTTIVTSGTICTSTSSGSGTCNGDSGGALTYLEADGQYTQIGVVSFVASSGCASGYPNGFTRVTNYMGWISSITGIAYRK